jgi:hypothetical protein
MFIMCNAIHFPKEIAKIYMLSLAFTLLVEMHLFGLFILSQIRPFPGLRDVCLPDGVFDMFAAELVCDKILCKEPYNWPLFVCVMESVLYSGEEVELSTKHDGVKITASTGQAVYVVPKGRYVVGPGVTSLVVEHVRFKSGPLQCASPYCLVNSPEMRPIEEVIVSKQEYRVEEPFSIEERVSGNSIRARVFPRIEDIDTSKICVSVNGRPMTLREERYSLRLGQLEDEDFEQLVFCVAYGSIQYKYISSLACPREFRYSMGVETRAGKYYLRITIFRRAGQTRTFSLRFKSPIEGEEGRKGHGTFRVPKREMEVESVDDVMELFFEFLLPEEGRPSKKVRLRLDVNSCSLSTSFVPGKGRRNSSEK